LKESKLRLSETKFSKKDIKDGIVNIRQNLAVSSSFFALYI
ncbi:8876_t:CDS:2, partial [Gigaspora margarita]